MRRREKYWRNWWHLWGHLVKTFNLKGRPHAKTSQSQKVFLDTNREYLHLLHRSHRVPFRFTHLLPLIHSEHPLPYAPHNTPRFTTWCHYIKKHYIALQPSLAQDRSQKRDSRWGKPDPPPSIYHKLLDELSTKLAIYRSLSRDPRQWGGSVRPNN